MKLDPITIGNRLRNAQFNPDVIDEIKRCIEVANIWEEEKTRFENGIC